MPPRDIGLIDEQSFRNVIQKKLKGYQLLHQAIGAGVLLLLLVAFLYGVQGAHVLPMLTHPTQWMPWASYVHAFVVVACMLFSGFFPGMMWAEAKVNTAEELFTHLQTVRLVQLALLEFPALVGILVCLVGVRNDVMPIYSVYWLNLLSTAYFFVRLFMIFPNEEKLLARLRDLT